jgi:hypothetical protein
MQRAGQLAEDLARTDCVACCASVSRRCCAAPLAPARRLFALRSASPAAAPPKPLLHAREQVGIRIDPLPHRQVQPGHRFGQALHGPHHLALLRVEVDLGMLVE